MILMVTLVEAIPINKEVVRGVSCAKLAIECGSTLLLEAP